MQNIFIRVALATVFLSVALTSVAWAKRTANRPTEEMVAIDVGGHGTDSLAVAAGPTKLEQAILKNNVGHVGKLVKSGEDYKQPGLVAMATCHQYWHIVNFFLKADEDDLAGSSGMKLVGLDLDGVYEWEGKRFTALEWAIYRKSSYTALKLIKKGASYNHQALFAMALQHRCWAVLNSIVRSEDRRVFYRCANDERPRTLCQWVRFHWQTLIAETPEDADRLKRRTWEILALRKLAKHIKAF